MIKKLNSETAYGDDPNTVVAFVGKVANTSEHHQKCWGFHFCGVNVHREFC